MQQDTSDAWQWAVNVFQDLNQNQFDLDLLEGGNTEMYSTPSLEWSEYWASVAAMDVVHHTIRLEMETGDEKQGNGDADGEGDGNETDGEKDSDQEENPSESSSASETDDAFTITQVRGRKRQHSRQVKQILENWWQEYFHWPCPAGYLLDHLVRRTDLDRRQILKWFDNKRQRFMRTHSRKAAPFATVQHRGRLSSATSPLIIDTRQSRITDDILSVVVARIDKFTTESTRKEPVVVIVLLPTDDVQGVAQSLSQCSAYLGTWPHLRRGLIVMLNTDCLRHDWQFCRSKVVPDPPTPLQ